MLIQLSSFQETWKATSKATMAGRDKKKKLNQLWFSFILHFRKPIIVLNLKNVQGKKFPQARFKCSSSKVLAIKKPKIYRS